MQTSLYTIGHSNHNIDRFIWLLKNNDVAVIADVRSIPASRHNPQFNRDILRRSLAAAGITYVHMGDALGAMTDNPALMENGRVSFAKIAASQPFKMGITRLLEVAKKHRIALMCAEKDPLSCHRTLLVSRQLEKEGAHIQHILHDGTREKQADTMNRLLALTNTPAEDLFLSQEALINQACLAWEAKMLKA